MPQTLTDAAATLGWKPYRLRQVRHAREQALVESWDAVTTLSKTDREFLNANVPFSGVSIVTTHAAEDGSAVKFLLKATDGVTFEIVLLLHKNPKKRWATVCLSSQIGCPVGCTFCATGQMKFLRNLTSEEILDSYLIAARAAKQHEITGNLNIVFMGMGEPLLNLDALIPTIKALTDRERFFLAPQRITVSTSGIVPGLQKLREANVGDIGLALSLHSPIDAMRTKLMPINGVYPLADVMAELKKWEKLGTEILYEYILIEDVTDTPECERALVALLRGRLGKLNLIPLNPIPGSPHRRPPLEKMREFRASLERAGVMATLRHTKGDEIAAACGQLKTAQASNLPTA